MQVMLDGGFEVPISQWIDPRANLGVVVPVNFFLELQFPWSRYIKSSQTTVSEASMLGVDVLTEKEHIDVTH